MDVVPVVALEGEKVINVMVMRAQNHTINNAYL